MKRKIITPLIITFLVSMLVFVGCSGESNKSADSSNLTAEKKNFEERELIAAIPEANNDFDPYADYGYNSIGFFQVYDSIVEKNSSGEIVPSIAEKFEVSTDAMTYKFWIRKGIKFSNGTELKASDIKFSFEKASTSPYTSFAIPEYESCDIIDDYTVEVKIKYPSASFLEKLTSWFFVVSEDAYSKHGDQFGKTTEAVIGTGAYILKEWKPSELCVFEANPDYFKGEADIKKVRFKTITDVNAAVIALQTKEVDLCLMDIPGVSINKIEANDELTLTKFPSKIFMQCIMNNESGPFSDVRLRRAVAYAVDRNKALTVGTEGQGTIVDSPGGWDYTGNPGVETWDYDVDIEKAKKLVKEAGMVGETIVIKTYATDPYPKIATSFQSDLSKIGLNVEVLQMERNAFIEDVLSNGKYDIAICRFGSGTKDMDEVMTAHLCSENIGISGNWSRYSNPEMDKILFEARNIVDIDKRKKLYTDAIKIYTDDVVEIPIYYSLSNSGYTNDIMAADIGLIEFNKIYNFKWND